MGDIGIFSFDAVKNLAVGEGGGITSKNKSLIQEAKFCDIAALVNRFHSAVVMLQIIKCGGNIIYQKLL